MWRILPPENKATSAGRVKGPKELVWLPGSQIDFYDQPAQVDPAVAAVTGWFTRTLSAN